MVITQPPPQATDLSVGVTQAQEHHQAAKAKLAGVLTRIDEIRGDAEGADVILSKADAAVGRAKWAGRDMVKVHQDSENAARVMSECSAALELAPVKLREGLRAVWTAEIALAEAQAQQEEAEALQGREDELKPLETAWGRERAEAHLEKEYALPELHGSVLQNADGSMGAVFPVGQQLTVTRPPWFVALHAGIPNRRARVRALEKLLAALSDRTDADLEKVSRKLAAQPA